MLVFLTPEPFTLCHFALLLSNVSKSRQHHQRRRGISAHPKVEFDFQKFSSIKMASTPRHVSGRHSSASHSHHHSSFKPEMHPSGVVSGPNSRANSRQHRHHHHHHHHRRNREHHAESSGHGGISFVVEKPRKYIMESEMEIADEDLILGERPFSKRSHHHQVNLLYIILWSQCFEYSSKSLILQYCQIFSNKKIQKIN